MEDLLKPLLGNTKAHVCNSVMTEILDSLVLGPSDRLVSLDVVSLFTRDLLKATLELLTTLFPETTIQMFEFVLTSTYYTYRGEFYEQVKGVAMGSPLALCHILYGM